VNLYWSQVAVADMERIWHFLAKRRIDLADHTEAAIRQGVERLVHLPHLGRPNADGGRELLLASIQYKIGYVVRDDSILIATVRSTKEAS
jgi:plasmid stabilization system protein ParE